MDNDNKSKILNCFDRLQRLQIAPTLNNMETLIQTLYDLRDVYNKLDNGGNADDGTNDKPNSKGDDR